MVYQNQLKIEAYYDIISTKNQLRHGQQEPKLGAPSRGKNGPFQGQQGEGVALSFLGPQSTILTTEIP